jgi:hypothetical protein
MKAPLLEKAQPDHCEQWGDEKEADEHCCRRHVGREQKLPAHGRSLLRLDHDEIGVLNQSDFISRARF